MLCDAWNEASPEFICQSNKKLKLHPDNSQPNSEPDQHHPAESMVKMFQQVQWPENEVSLNAHDLED